MLKEMPELELCAGPYECAADADALVIVTEWEQFRALDLEQLKAAMAQPIMVDLRNAYNAAYVKQAGFTYYGIGKGSSA